MKAFNNAKRAVGVAALAVASFGAQASDYTLGPLTVPYFLALNPPVLVAPGDFSDTFSFSLNTNVDAGGSVSNVSNKGYALTFNNVELYYGLLGSGTKVDDLYSGPGATFVTGSGTLAPGSYYFLVEGNASGVSGGKYGVLVTGNQGVSPVPEPESYAMLLAGLGVMGAIAMRRKSKSN